MSFNNVICRICLQDGAIYPIFNQIDNVEQDIRSKILICLHVTIEDIPGYPRQMCKECYETLDVLCNFINKYKESSKALENIVKKENDVYSDSKSDVGLCIEDIKDEPPDNLNVDVNQRPLKISKAVKCKVVAKQKKEVKNAISKMHVTKNNTNKIASSILEGEFSWSGEEWCLNTNKAVATAQQTERKSHKLVQNIPKEKKPPPPKLCDLCGEVFKYQDKLSIHKRKVHYKNPVKCPKCPRICLSDYYLKRHIKRKHENKKEFVCTTCGRGFAFKGELTSHCKNVHDGVRPKKIFSCKICNKTYKCFKSVVIHERSVHTGDRPAVCLVCGSSFFHEDYLKEHMRLHTGETPFKCPICGRGYAQRCNMKCHLRSHRVSELDASMLSKIKPNYLKMLKA